MISLRVHIVGVTHPLRIWRKAKKMTQEKVAAGVGLRCASHISQLETGKKGVSLETAVAIEKFTNGVVTASALLGGTA